MPGTDSSLLLSQLSEFVSAQIGLDFPPARWHDLERGITSAAREFRAKDRDEFIRQLLREPLTRPQIEILASHLTIGETYFFREPRTFEILETQVLPQLISARRKGGQRLRIWSAGCATGEEAYSLAILLHKLLPDGAQWNLTVLATDINPGFLTKAAAGVYRDWSFRGAPPWDITGYFREGETGARQVIPSIRKAVKFSLLNLARDEYPSLLNNTNAMDLILCRNVLMYFTAQNAARVVGNLFQALADDGWLIVSPCEVSPALFADFRAVRFPGATFYQKQARSSRNSTGPALANLGPATLPGDCVGAPGGLPPSLSAGVKSLKATPEVQFFPRPGRKLAITGPPSDQSTALSRREEGFMLYREGRYREAAERMATHLAQYPGDAAAMELSAKICANLGQLERALEWCEKAVAADKLNGGYYYLRAIILLEQGAADLAHASLRQALYLDPEFALAHFALGNVLRQLGKPQESERHFANALAILDTRKQEDPLPEFEGLTAGRLAQIIRSESGRPR